jgi:hypothetical protein
VQCAAGDDVEVLEYRDPEGNEEWWLVRRVADGKEGYIAANFLEQTQPE